MNDTEIVKSIIKTIADSSFKQAIMIDGEWGSGKTYFVNSVLRKALLVKQKKEKNEKSYKVGYFSLNGISSIDDLKSEITMFIALNKSTKWFFREKIKESTSSALMHSASTILNVVNFSFRQSLEIFRSMNCSEYVLIFDDLERCLLPISQTMGFINYFSEHLGAKVIVVSNQDEIGLTIDGTDLASKYSVVLNDKLLPGRYCEKNELKKDEEFTLSDLEGRTKEIFSKNNEYNRVKEKLIGWTIKYIPDLDSVYEILIKDSSNPLFDQLSKAKSDTLYIFKTNKHYNLRTLTFFLSCARDIIEAIDPIFSKHDLFNEMIQDVLKYIAYSSIRYKQGLPSIKWEDNSLYSTIKLESTNSTDYVKMQFIPSFKFVDTYVYSRFIQEEEVRITLKEYLENQVSIRENRAIYQFLSLYKLDNWINYDDISLKNILVDLKQELIKKNYDISEYQKIISLLCMLEEYGFELEIIKYIDIMVENIKCSKIDFSSRIGIWFDIESQDKKVSKYYRMINNAILQNKNEALIRGIYDCLNKENWSTLLQEYVALQNKNFLSQKAFMSLFQDIQILVELLNKASSKEIMSFYNSLNTVYGFTNLKDFYLSDLPFIKELSLNLDSQTSDNMDLTRKIARKQLSKKLSELQMMLE